MWRDTGMALSPVNDDSASMKSNRSMESPPVLQRETPSLDPRPQEYKPVSSVDRCKSVKSNWSINTPPVFQSILPPDPKSGQPAKNTSRATCVIVGNVTKDPRSQEYRPGSMISQCETQMSTWSIVTPPVFHVGTPTPDMSVSSLTQDQSRCEVCKQLLNEPVITTCKHSFCMMCFRSVSGPSGDSACPVCRKRSITEFLVDEESGVKHLDNDHTPVKRTRLGEVLIRVQKTHKKCMKRRFESICEGVDRPGSRILLNKIYTELYITEGESEGVNNEHEVWQVESASRPQTTEGTPINCNDIFKPLPGQERHIRSVMTKGIAGIGKTVSVQKFILDWAEENTNQEVDFMFVLPFRELNLVKQDQYSFHRLLLDFHPELKELQDAEYKDCHIVFIFDGLDESRLSLDFQNNQKLTDVTHTSSVDVLMTSLIQGSLLPSAFIWITSRPAAANQIPLHYFNLVTEVRGFSDTQKEEYFRKRISEENQANRIISHIKASKSLHIMCHMPVFCWISATVLQQLLKGDNNEAPKTLTEMFIHFLLIQTTRKNQKYHEECEMDRKSLLESHKDAILKLAELAFTNLENGNLMFYEEDLRVCGIDVSEASVYSGMCTEIFREECVFNYKKLYCFVHLSIQEFLAALYFFAAYLSKNTEVLKPYLSRKSKSSKYIQLEELLKNAINKALESKNGHLDLFVRFLHGISLESNQKLLLGLLTHTHSSPESVKKTIRNLKVMQRPNISPERCINLFHCLVEMHDSSVQEEIQAFLKTERGCVKQLSLAHCSALAHMLLMSDEVMEDFDLTQYQTSPEGRRRLVPAVRCCRNALLIGCNLTETSCETVAFALQSTSSPLKHLDMRHNDLQKSGEKLISALLSPNCSLESLRFSSCNLSERSCELMASALPSLPSLIDLDLSDNDLTDSGVEFVSEGLGNSQCRLQILRLSGCQITHKGFSFLALALKSNPSYLKELDLSYNDPGDSGICEITERLNDPICTLQTFRCESGGESRMRAGLSKYACNPILDPNTAHRRLCLSNDYRTVRWVREEQPYPEHPERFNCPQVLCTKGLSGCCYWEVEWSGEVVEVAVSYKSIGRKGAIDYSVKTKEWIECEFGWNTKSWSLYCSGNRYSAWYNNKRTDVAAPSSGSRRVGVYLNCPAGTLSFYSVSPHTLIHLHTFCSTFTEPLYPGFRIVDYNSSVSLCYIT